MSRRKSLLHIVDFARLILRFCFQDRGSKCRALQYSSRYAAGTLDIVLVDELDAGVEKFTADCLQRLAE